MSDKTSFRELSQSIQHIDILRDMPDVAEDEREEMRQYIEDLTPVSYTHLTLPTTPYE